MKSIRRSLVAVLASLCAAHADAQCGCLSGSGCGVYYYPDCGTPEISVSVGYSVGGGLCPDAVCIGYSSGYYSISVTLNSLSSGKFYTVNISGLSLTDVNISSISIDAPQAAGLTVSLSNVGHTKSISRTNSGELVLVGAISGDLGDSGTIAVTQLGFLDSFTVGGDVLSALTLSEPATAYFGPDRVALRVDGNLVGDIEVPSGFIASIDVDGAIGSSVDPVSILSEQDITFVSADEIHADIEAGWDGPTSNIRILRTTSGNFTGSLVANTIGAALNFDDETEGTPSIRIAGDLGETGYPATIEFTGGARHP